MSVHVKIYGLILCVLGLWVTLSIMSTPAVAAINDCNPEAEGLKLESNPSDSDNPIPVVLVHGKAGSPQDWKNKVMWASGLAEDIINDPNALTFVEEISAIDSTAVYSYDYSGSDNPLNPFDPPRLSERWVDDRSVGGRFLRGVRCLYRTYDEQRVVVVAHSMGALVAQYAAKEEAADKSTPERIGLVISIGTPYGGSNIVAREYVWALDWLVGVIGKVNTPAGRALMARPENDYLKLLATGPGDQKKASWNGNVLTNTHWTAPVYAIAAQIKLVYNRNPCALIGELFGCRPKSRWADIGDVIVLTSSAIAPVVESQEDFHIEECKTHITSFSDESTNVRGTIDEVYDDVLLGVAASKAPSWRVLGLQKLGDPCWHGNLLNVRTIRNKVSERVQKYVEDHRPTALSRPSLTDKNNVGDDFFVLSWLPVPGAYYYECEYRSDSNEWERMTLTGTLSHIGSCKFDSSMSNYTVVLGNSYAVRVRACIESGRRAPTYKFPYGDVGAGKKTCSAWTTANVTTRSLADAPSSYPVSVQKTGDNWYLWLDQSKAPGSEGLYQVLLPQYYSPRTYLDLPGLGGFEYYPLPEGTDYTARVRICVRGVTEELTGVSRDDLDRLGKSLWEPWGDKSKRWEAARYWSSDRKAILYTCDEWDDWVKLAVSTV